MRRISWTLAVVTWLAYSCASTKPAAGPPTEVLHGVASWYGQEFAGRTTANGEIFDPMLLTAAHRTLPFGTVLDVTNAKNGQSVRVRINDRGPFVGKRLIDLSYAAALKVGLVEPGSGEVDLVLVKLGRGDREPPAPYVVTIAEPVERITVIPSTPVATVAPPVVNEPPKIEFPLPAPAPAPVVAPAPVAAAPPENDFHVEVVEQHKGVDTRRQVSASGTTVESVPVTVTDANGKPVPLPASETAGDYDATHRPAPPKKVSPASGGWLVQVGAFAIEKNALSLLERCTKITQPCVVVHDGDLFRVRVGPFPTREKAIGARETVEAGGMSGIVIHE